MKENKCVTEWAIIFKDDIDDYDGEFYTENEQEYLDLMQELEDNNKLHTIYQAYKKDYIWNSEIDNWEEDNVDVLYDNVNDTTPLTESNNINDKAEDIKRNFEKYKIDNNFKEKDIDEDIINMFFSDVFVDTVEDEDTLEAINIAEKDIRKKYNLKENRELTESKESIPNILSFNEYDGGWKNNPTTYYGKLSDETYYLYCPDDSDEIGIYDEPCFNILKLYYYNSINDEELDANTYEAQIEDYKDKHLIKSLIDGKLYDNIIDVCRESGKNIDEVNNKEEIKPFDIGDKKEYKNKEERNEALASDILRLLKHYNITLDVIIYYNGKRMFAENEKVEKANVEDYLEYSNPDTVSMSFEGELNHILNGACSDLELMDRVLEDLSKLFDKYDMYYEMGDAWNLTTYENTKTESKQKLNKKAYIKESEDKDVDVPVIENEMTEDDVKASVKKEIYQYAKQEGLDVEKLRKKGIELSEVADVLDTVIGNMVSKSIIEYEDVIGQPIGWDFTVQDNDIKVEIIKY